MLPFFLGKVNFKKSMPLKKKISFLQLSLEKTFRFLLAQIYTVHVALAVAYMAPGEQKNARECTETFSNPTIRKGLLTQAHKALHPQLSDRCPTAPWTCHRHMCTNRPRALPRSKAGEGRQEKMVSWQWSLTPSGGCNRSTNSPAIGSTFENVNLETPGSATPLQYLWLSAKENLSWEMPWEQ